ncbi:hypothetical protein TNCV_4352971 [Trichonephila clavipes]|nr:hypothetical protein TNCV_4352971 [Trichonephila clavipes]
MTSRNRLVGLTAEFLRFWNIPPGSVEADDAVTSRVDNVPKIYHRLILKQKNYLFAPRITIIEAVKSSLNAKPVPSVYIAGDQSLQSFARRALAHLANVVSSSPTPPAFMVSPFIRKNLLFLLRLRV